MKTNNTKARENIRKYIIANFTPEGYTDNPPQEFPEIARFILSTFRKEKYNTPEDFRYYRKNELAAFADWCAGLCGVLVIFITVLPLVTSAQFLKKQKKKKRAIQKNKPKIH